MIGFHCGLILQQDFDRLTGIPKAEMKHMENNCELYFEIEYFDDFVAKLKQPFTSAMNCYHSRGKGLFRYLKLYL